MEGKAAVQDTHVYKAQADILLLSGLDPVHPEAIHK